MSIIVRWYDERKNIIIQEFIGSWNEKDVADMIDEVSAMKASVHHTVHVINDLTRNKTHPIGLFRILAYADSQIPSNEGIKVTVGMPRFVNQVIDAFKGTFPRLLANLYMADTLAEAVATIIFEDNWDEDEWN